MSAPGRGVAWETPRIGSPLSASERGVRGERSGSPRRESQTSPPGPLSEAERGREALPLPRTLQLVLGRRRQLVLREPLEQQFQHLPAELAHRPGVLSEVEAEVVQV